MARQGLDREEQRSLEDGMNNLRYTDAHPQRQGKSTPLIRSLQEANDRAQLGQTIPIRGVSPGPSAIPSPAPPSPKPKTPHLEQKELPKTAPKPALLQHKPLAPSILPSEPVPRSAGPLPSLDRGGRPERQWEPSSFTDPKSSRDGASVVPAPAAIAPKKAPSYKVDEPTRLSTTGVPQLVTPQGPRPIYTQAALPQHSLTYATVPEKNLPSSPYGGLTCSKCFKPIGERTLKALGRHFHPECFRCRHCGTGLEHVAFLEHGGDPYCHLDYHELFSERCAQCKTPIEGEMIQAPTKEGQMKSYHPLHFFCAGCGNPFVELTHGGEALRKFIWKDDYPYCQPCHQSRFAVRCKRPDCRMGPQGTNIIPDGSVIIKALGSTWHDTCFTCSRCHTKFQDGLFVVNRGEAWHQNCLRAERG